MTANIVFVLRVFGPGLGRFARAGFLFSRYGLRLCDVFRALPDQGFRAKTSGARTPRRMVRTYSRHRPQVKEKQAEKPPKWKDLAAEAAMASGE
jgi:hypothetical protein